MDIFFKIILTLQVVLFITEYGYGLDNSNKQRQHNANVDFLLHETGNLNPSTGKPLPEVPNNNVWGQPSKKLQNSQQSPEKQDYESQFPALKTPTGRVPTSTQMTLKSQQNEGKRDYVNPNFPKLTSPPLSSQTTDTPKIGSKPNKPLNSPTTPPSSGKRDYVNPNYANGSGKVKDLVNFYDSKSHDQTVTPKPPSYSSIVHGDKKNTPTPVPAAIDKTRTTSATSSTTKRPSSLDNTVTNSKPGPPKPTTRVPVLPSSILNNNKNGQPNSNTLNDAELQSLSEELLRKDTNNAVKYITINYQEKTTSQSNEDKAPLPLLTIAPEAWNIPTVQKFLPLLDNYERDTLVNEYVTPQERNEENAFMDAIMSTSVIRHLMNYLKDKGYVTPDPKQQRDFLKQLWFSLYSRGKGKISSSGFEHVFLSELKNGEVMGLHNWIYFSKQETANNANYLGYMKYLQLSDKGVVIKIHFNQGGINKPVNSMFIGTSPELEIALYTLCFVTRPDNDCRLRLGTKYVDIVTHTFRYRSKNLIGSAYPQI